MIVHSIKPSATWVVRIGVQLDPGVTAQCLGHNKPAAAKLIPSRTGYFSSRRSTYPKDMQNVFLEGGPFSHA